MQETGNSERRQSQPALAGNIVVQGQQHHGEKQSSASFLQALHPCICNRPPCYSLPKIIHEVPSIQNGQRQQIEHAQAHADKGQQPQKVNRPVSENINFIVPLRTVQELLRLLADDSDVEISVLENNVIFTEKDRFILYSRLISGNYPNYDAVIPKESTTEFNINPKLLTNALERSKVC